MGSIEAVTSQAVRSKPKVEERKQQEEAQKSRASVERPVEARSEDAVVVNIDSSRLEEREADALAQSVSSRIRDDASVSLGAQPEPEPQVVKDLLA